MKKSFLLLVLLFVAFMSCKNSNNNELRSGIADGSVFSPALEKEILRMIEIKNAKIKEDKICNVVIFQDKENDKNCFVTISLSMNIIQNIIKFTPPSNSLESQVNSNTAIIGYTFLENELIGCCILSDLCNNGLINEKELIPIKDSIPGYPNALNHDSDLIYDAPMRMYQIINADTLQLIKSFFIPNL